MILKKNILTISAVISLASRVAWIVLFVSASCLGSSHVFIIVVDGVRYSESLGGKANYMPHIWNDLRPKGTIYTNFRNDGLTLTCPGHAAILTGNWQKIANDGSEEFSDPTLFELFRKQTKLPEQSCYVVSGKAKLRILSHSTNGAYGEKYGAIVNLGESGTNIDTWERLAAVMSRDHPNAVIVNFAETDIAGHAGKWDRYVRAAAEVDSLIWLLWNKIQSDSLYKNSTTLFVTNDHGRHDDQHGGFKNHGDSCEGCRHIMLLALGPAFKAGGIVNDPAFQVDLAPTAAGILGLDFPVVQGRNLLHGKSVQVK
ncbi:MAG TPA: alkaline phosphatase family protein [Bacteroidota bacterium]|jgi:hypothetical protein|nr:alkaline phosphatase family protein [Bacteroidota bacterium]